MSALHAALLTRTPDELVALSVLSSRFNSSPCPFEDGTITRLDEPSLEDALPRPLTLKQIEKIRDLVVPEGVVFNINGVPIPPGTRLNDALDMFEEDYGDYGYPDDDEEETCRGCIGGMKGGNYHSGPGGCLC
jgi:hypothetical protein